jgi:hypothetical protein
LAKFHFIGERITEGQQTVSDYVLSESTTWLLWWFNSFAILHLVDELYIGKFVKYINRLKRLE